MDWKICSSRHFRFVLFALGALLPFTQANAETVTEKWIKHFNPSPAFDGPTGVTMDASGNVIITGEQHPGGVRTSYMAKYAAADGALLWSVSPEVTGWIPEVASNGDIIVASGTGDDVHLARYAGSDGHLLWEITGPGGLPKAMKLDGAGDIVITAPLQNDIRYDPLNGRPYFICDFYTAKYSATNGQLLWKHQYNGPANEDDRPLALAVDSHGNVIVTGASQDANQDGEMYTAKYAANDGHLLWERRYNGANPNRGDSGNAVAVDYLGDVLVTGTANSFHLYAAKYSGVDGHIIWEKIIPPPGGGSRRGLAVVADLTGNAVVAGFDNGTFYLGKLRAGDGGLIWEKLYLPASASFGGEIHRVMLDSVGNLLVSAVFNSGDAQRSDYFVGKFLSADGALLWEKTFDSPQHLDDVDAPGKPFALAPDGSVAVAIQSSFGSPDWEFVTIKYAVSGIKRPNAAVNGVLGPTTFSVRHSSNPGTNSSGTQSRLGSPSAAAEDELGSFLEFLAVQLSAVPGLKVQVQYSTIPANNDSWFALQNGNQGRLARDPATGIFIAKSSDFPRIANVSFRALVSAPGYPDTYSNIAGPFDLRQKPETLEPTVFRIFGEDQPSPVFPGHKLRFTALQTSQAPGVALRVQYSFLPQMESSWTDMENGLMPLAGANHALVSSSYPTGTGIYFRVISAAPGKIDSISNIIGPWNLTRTDLPAVQINLAENQTFSRNSPVPISVTATDSNGISRVELYVDGELHGIDTAAPYQFNLQGLDAGTHSLIAFAYDKLFSPNSSNLIERITLTDSRFTIYNRTSDGAWNDASGWSPQSVPGANDIVGISGGRSVALGGNVTVRGITLEGRLIGPGTLNVTEQMSWINGRIDSLTLNILSNARFIAFGGGEKFLTNVTTNNAGSYIVADAGINGAQDTVFNNTGTFTFARQLGQILEGTVPIATFGTVKFNAGQIRVAGGLLVAPNFTQNNGNLQLGTPLISDNGAALVSDHGLGVVSNHGGSVVSEHGGSLQALKGAGVVSNHGGSLISDNGACALNGGSITGFGRIDYPNFNHNGGFFQPGNSPGGVDITGDYTQGPNATLVLEIGGTDGLGGDYDIVAVKGIANLAGNLILHSINGFQSQGSGVVPLGYGSITGQFKSVSSNGQVTLGSKGALVTVDGVNPPLPRALNISTRLQIQSGDNALFAGFIVTGPAGSTKKVLIRGIGPSLAQFGVPGTIPDPFLELHTSSATITNDDWQQAPNTNDIPNGFAPSNPKESVIIATLSPGGYSAILKGAHGETGVGLAEVYDLEPNSGAQLANIATRGLVQTGDNVLIGGFVVAGTQPAKVLVRAIGPSLSAFGLQGALQDPILEVHDANGGAIGNDNWRATQEAEIIATTIPPTHDNEAAVLAVLTPGNYTAVVRGKDNTTGIAVVEAYNLQ